MADVLVTGIKIGDMPLKGTVSGNEKLPTGDVGDLAVTPNQIKSYTIETGNLVNGSQLDDAIKSVEQSASGLAGRVSTLENKTSHIDNTSDLNKPISNATQAALDLKASKVYVDSALALKADKNQVVSSFNGQVGAVTLNQSDLVDVGTSFTESPTFQNVPKLVKNDGSAIPEFDSQIQPIVNRLAVHRQGLSPTFDQTYATSIGGYPINSRIMLSNGTIVKSTISGNMNNPNNNMTGWVNFELDQQQVNSTIIPKAVNYDAIRSINSVSKTTATAMGRNNIFDGGYGVFAVKDSDTTSLDNDGTILVDSIGRRWHRIMTTEYGNPEWFGMSESVADNTPLVEKCLNIVGSAFIRKGDFPIQTTLKVLSGQSLIGFNEKSCFVMNDPTKGVIITHDGVANKTQPNVTIKGIRAKGTALYGFGLTHCTQSNFENLSVDGITAEYGFIYESFWNTHIKDHKTNGAIITNTCFAVNKIVLNTEFDALYSSNAAPYNIKIDSGLALISNNTWAGFGDLVFTGVAFQGATKYALSIVAGNGITFNTAYMENCLGALHIGFAQDVVFNLCVFVGLKSGESTHSMWLGSNSSNTMTGITFNQCKLPAATYPVVIDYAGAGITFNQPRCVGNIAASSLIQRTSNTFGNMPISIYRDADSTGATADVRKTNNGAWKFERVTWNDTGTATRTIIVPPITSATMINL